MMETQMIPSDLGVARIAAFQLYDFECIVPLHAWPSEMKLSAALLRQAFGNSQTKSDLYNQASLHLRSAE